MYDRVMDLEKFGINFRYDDSQAPGKFRIVYQYHSVPSSFNFDGVPLKIKLTAEAKRRGVDIINRVQVTDLIKTNGQISGAVGVNTRTSDIYLFKAKAVVLCSGGRQTRIHRNPSGVDFNTFSPPTLTGDGYAMAMRAGLPIVSMESLTGKLHLRAGANYNPNYGDPGNTTQPAARIIDWKGNVLVPRTQFYDWNKLGKKKWSPDIRQEWLRERASKAGGMGFRNSLSEMHDKGEGPFYLDFSEATDYEAKYIEWSIKNEGRGTQFWRYFEDEEGFDLRKDRQEYGGYGTRENSFGKGLWVDKDLETDIKNLFAAGDEVGGFIIGLAAPGAIAGGWYAGEMAAKRALGQKEFLPIDENIMKARKTLCSEILNCKRGFFWKEIEIYIQNLMDFYCGEIRSEGMLKRGLERLEYAKSAPIKAENPHELARSLEVKSIMENAEMVLRASLERKESRPAPLEFRRVDYPETDDKDWSCFLGIQREGTGFTFKKFHGNR
jgi:succinate dehydrogenase/fumarate reductase flavoprotein subunit